MGRSIKRFPSFFVVLGLLLTTLFLLPSYGAYANPIVDVATLDVEDHPIDGEEPLTETGKLNGANYKIRVPANWNNGTLVVYAHGYRDKADHDGETDNTSADAAPGGTAMEDILVQMGYAVAGSSFSENGWAVEQGIADTLALTNYFSETIGEPSKTILWGFSMGSAVTFKSIELYPDVYDGAIPACAVGAGATMAWDSVLAPSLAYDIAFGWPESWGTVADIRDDLDFETEVLPVLGAQLQDQSNFGKFEFMRLVSGLPEEAFYDVPSGWIFIDMLYLTEARAELERRAGGVPIQNTNHIYTLTDEEKTYLAGLGVDADAMLTEINSRTNIEADADARSYLEQYANYTGNITNPVLTLHTRADGLVAVNNESVYRDLVATAGASGNLYQVYTNSVGHCTFSSEELIQTLAAMDMWLSTGTAPTAANFTAEGFLPDFEPPAWPISFSDIDPTNVSLSNFSGQATSGAAWFALLPMLMVLAGLLYLRRRK